VSQHLHVHLVPRWVGDTNFTVTIANTKVLSETLASTADRLRAAWPKGR
jgi:ATP adenylyltransferase